MHPLTKLLAALAIAAAACEGPALIAGPTDGTTLKVAMVLPGKVNEPGYFNAGFQALLAVRSNFGAKVTYVEGLKSADADQVLRSLGDDGYSYVIVMGGGTYDDQIREVAADYPRLKFIVVSGSFTRLPNIVAVRTGNPGIGYLAGVLMSAMSKSGKIGLIGGRASPAAVADHVAVIAGARSVRADIRILDVYTESYSDPSLGKEAALAQIDEGADIIFTNANTTSFGVFQAVHERHVLAVGSATDQNSVCPDSVLSSVLYGMDTAVTHLIALDRSGPGWEDRIYTVDLSAVGLAPFHSLGGLVPGELRARLENVKGELLASRIRVPRTYAELNAATKPAQE